MLAMVLTRDPHTVWLSEQQMLTNTASVAEAFWTAASSAPCRLRPLFVANRVILSQVSSFTNKTEIFNTEQSERQKMEQLCKVWK